LQLSQPTSITVNVRPGRIYIFTALWDSEHVYLRPTTLSPAEMAKLGLWETLFESSPESLPLRCGETRARFGLWRYRV